MADITFTVDGKKLHAPAGKLLIEACKSAGIEVPSFCYYPGLSLQAACRMCLVEIEKTSKLQTACTVPVAEGMVVTTDSATVHQARKSMLELLLGNHPLDCPVCDAGGECELQDMTFKYGAADSRFMEGKLHKDEQQWSPVVFFDRPRCILCYRCVRVCGEGMDVWALGVQNRGVRSLIAPNREDHLDCEECGMCIDICPVGALTSGAYRYKTRPWEMKHVATVCTHCSNGCKTTLGVRRSEKGLHIVRGDNRDKNGINGDFLCIKGRYAFDFAENAARLTEPLIRKNGALVRATWEEALEHVASRLSRIKQEEGSNRIGVVGSTRTTNEENYLLQKFARLVLGTNNIDHHRTADYPAFAHALQSKTNSTATMRDLLSAPAILLVGSDPTYQHPLVAWNIRTNVRLHQARLYVINAQDIKLRRQSVEFLHVPSGMEGKTISAVAGNAEQFAGVDSDRFKSLIEKLRKEKDLVIVFGSELRGPDIASLVKFGNSLPGTRYICLGDYANSRGAADMGLYPDLLPGYLPISANSIAGLGYSVPLDPGMNLPQMIQAANSGDLGALYIVGANPFARYPFAGRSLAKTFIVAQDMFLTETAEQADVVLPSANAYEKSGTFTNTCGDLQQLKKAGDFAGVKSDFEMIVRVAEKMGFEVSSLVPFGGSVRTDMGQSRGAQSGEADRHAIWLAANNLEPKLSPLDPEAIFDEIQRLVPGYNVSRINLVSGSDVSTNISGVGRGSEGSASDLIWPANDTLFTSGTLGTYSRALNSVAENSIAIAGKEAAAD